MARPRTYEPEAALEQAMRLFWEKGYEATSMADLVEATGVSRYGFYSEFGDKEALFQQCLDYYSRRVISDVVAPIEHPDATLADVRAYFDFLLASTRAERYRGCLIGNTAVSGADAEGRFAEAIEQHYGRLRDAFRNALQNAARGGELPNEADPGVLADYLVGVVNGFLGSLQADAAPTAIENYLTVALEALG